MPARGALAHITIFLGRGQFRSLARIEADDDDLELFARDKRERLQTAGQPVQHLVTKHRALVINEREDDRFAVEVIAEPDRLSRLVAEGEIERNLFIQPLIE